jgi:hypothetical protein
MKRVREFLNSEPIVLFPPDDKGYVGRQCPADQCKRYFKVKPGTGLKGDNLPLHCPYCGHEGRTDNFHTKEQIEYALSVVERSFHEAIVGDVSDLARDFNRRASGGIFSLTMGVKSSPVALRRYVEANLETEVECGNCSLQYSVYGVFAFCPECREHNSLHILDKSLGVVCKMLDVAETVEQELGDRLIENALGDCISSFDGFGRELCRIHSEKCPNGAKAGRTSFQNLTGANQNLKNLFNLDLRSGLDPDEWQKAVQAFQKRHLLSHKMGVVDNEYVLKTGDSSATVGRRISIEADEIRQLVRIVAKLARHLSTEFSKAQVCR